MSDVELLSVPRVANFIAYTLENDLQIKINRSSACSLLRSSIARERDIDTLSVPAEKFDKIMTFLVENDQQVHYASGSNTVGVYAFTRLVSDLRRQVRDYRSSTRSSGSIGSGSPMMSPRDRYSTEESPKSSPHGQMSLDLAALSRERARAQSHGGVESTEIKPDT